MALRKFISEPRMPEIGIDDDNVPDEMDILQYNAWYGVWFARSLNNAGIVAKALYEENSILIATDDDTPIALTIGTSTLIGRKATGPIDDLSPTDARTVLGLATTDSPVFVTVKLSGLTDGYIPVHTNDSTGLENGPLKTDVDSAVTLKHTQHTDTGTTGNTFTVDSDSTTGKIIIDVALDAADKSLTLTNTALTDNRIITFPDATGTVTLTTLATDTLWDAAGDLVVGSGANTAGRLAKGSDNEVLTMVAGVVAWAKAGTGWEPLVYGASLTPPEYMTHDGDVLMAKM
jgi:hypothetical protein